MANKQIVTWNDNDVQSREQAFAAYAEVPQHYEGIARAHHRSFLDIEPNRSVRTSFTRRDYDAFRPEESIPQGAKTVIKMCMDAYEKVGLVRNIIDLMGDFGCQGIQIVHESKSAEKLGQQWFKKINGPERSERFLNNLYRTGNVFVYKSYAALTPAVKKYMRSIANDIKVEVPDIEKNQLPWRYIFFNPLSIDIKDGNVNLFLGLHKYLISGAPFFDNFKDGTVPIKIMETLPPSVKQAVERGERQIPLDPERLTVCHYKKDDWQIWAHPLVYAILDDIVMLEKMKLADIAALDGAISNIRLWTVGDFEHKVLPTKEGINKLRNILASNVGGGTMELVLGPEVKFTESNSQVYKFLGSEKYQQTLNSIYAGLGVPPTLTGIAGQSGGFTNNFISLKTLVERLQYGRALLTKFWDEELEFVRKSLGIRKPFHVQYDQMTLSDEASEKNLLIQLADRDIISHQTVLERFKEQPGIEKVRLSREAEDRNKEKLPDKASPFHNANHGKDMEKIEKQGEINEKISVEKEKHRPKLPGGRPTQSKDGGPRKQRVKKPKTNPGVAELVYWATSAFDHMQSLNQGYIEMMGKKTLRGLTKAQMMELESIKLSTFLNLEPMETVDEKAIHKAISSGDHNIPVEFTEMRENSSSLESYRKKVIGTYVELILEEN